MLLYECCCMNAAGSTESTVTVKDIDLELKIAAD